MTNIIACVYPAEEKFQPRKSYNEYKEKSLIILGVIG